MSIIYERHIPLHSKEQLIAENVIKHTAMPSQTHSPVLSYFSMQSMILLSLPRRTVAASWSYCDGLPFPSTALPIYSRMQLTDIYRKTINTLDYMMWFLLGNNFTRQCWCCAWLMVYGLSTTVWLLPVYASIQDTAVYLYAFSILY